MNENDPFNALRERAYDLAKSGQFKNWMKIANALHGEGHVDQLIIRLNNDRLAVMMITRCCEQARSHK